MKFLALMMGFLSLVSSSLAQAEQTRASSVSCAVSTARAQDGARVLVPALGDETQGFVRGDLLRCAYLEPRDRSIIALSALIAQNQTAQMQRHFMLAIENGITPSEISEIITHLAFYSGWANAMSAAAIVRDVFAERGINADQLARTLGELLLFIDEMAVEDAIEAHALLRGLWLLPDLAPRDRSLVTFSALVASGRVAQSPYYLNRAMDSGLTQAQASEVIAHLAFYAGWENALSAASVVKDVFENRPNSHSQQLFCRTAGLTG